MSSRYQNIYQNIYRDIDQLMEPCNGIDQCFENTNKLTLMLIQSILNNRFQITEYILNPGFLNLYDTIEYVAALNLSPTDLIKIIDTLIDHGFIDFNFIVEKTISITPEYYSRYIALIDPNSMLYAAASIGDSNVMRTAMQQGAINIDKSLDKLLTIDYKYFYDNPDDYADDVKYLANAGGNGMYRYQSPDFNTSNVNRQLYQAVRDNLLKLVKTMIDTGADDIEGALNLAEQVNANNDIINYLLSFT